jgi:RNA polymerase sigma-70 factor (ECF subfamily)
VSPLRAVGDLDLAKRCCAGERNAQRDLFQREKRRVHATLYRVLGSNAEMDDLVQEAFLEIFKALRGFRGEASLGTWIDRITVRVAFAHISRRKVPAVSLAVVAELPAGDPTAEQRAMSRQAARRLYAVLDRIEARQRIAWTLHVLEGKPIAEVARVMEASAVLTKVRVWRARRAIEAHAERDPLLREFLSAGPAAREGREAP